MGPFDALKSFFTGQVEGRARVGDPFVQLDAKAIATNLRLEERGAEDGALCLPEPGQASLSSAEAEIVSEIETYQSEAQIDLRNQVQAYESRLGGLQLIHQTGSIRAEAVEAVGDFQTLVREWQDRTAFDRREVKDAYKDLLAFKAQHGLIAPARDVPPKIVTYGVIAIAGIVEILVNAVFLRVNDDFGYLGGIIGAIVVSAINIVMAIGFGRLLIPRKNLASLIDKLTGYASVVIWLLLTGGWNLLAAHYRDAKFSGFEAPEIAALGQIASEPFMLDGIFSVGIFIIGVFISVVVLVDAAKMDDPVPGYGEKSRECRARSEEYSDKIAEANEALSQVRNDAIEGANKVKEQLAVQLGERERIQRAYTRYVERFRQHEKHLDNVLNELLSIYRNANRKTRPNTCPAPDHFKMRRELQPSILQPLYVQPINESDIEDARNALDKCITDVDMAFRDSISKFPKLDDLISEIEDGPV